MTRRLLLVLPLLAGALPAAAQEAPPAPAPVPVQGVLEGRTTWRGVVLVTGDVEIPAGSSLEVEAGTRVILAPTDARKAGWNPDRVEIRVAGGLVVAGTEERPVILGPAGDPAPAEPLPEEKGSGNREKDEDLRPRYGWHGIVLLPSEGPPPAREIRGALLFDAWSAVQVPAGRVRVEGCVFLRCGTGIEAGTAYQDTERFGAPPGVARPEILRTRFAGCLTGVGAMLQAAPRLERCVVAHCRTGVGPRRHTGRFYPLHEPGSTLARCDLLGNGVGVVGACLVTDSVFHRNRRALALSSFHVEHATDVDEYRLRGNVFAGNGLVLAGESLAGEVAVLPRAGYALDDAALETAVGAPWPPLPADLRLAADAPARGRASGGGDPGCAAEAVMRGGTRGWASGRPPLPAGLAARIPAGREAEEGKGLGRLRPQAGASFGSSWWCAVEGDDAGVIPLGSLFGGADGQGVIAWKLESSGAGKGWLEVNGDLAFFEASWNGTSLAAPVLPRRFGAEGFTVEVVLKKGTNWFAAAVRGRGPAPRLGAALEPPEGVRVGEAEAPPAAREARVVSVKTERAKGGDAWLRIALSSPVSWAAPGTVRLAGADGGEVDAGGARVLVDQRQSLRFGPLPEGCPEDVSVRLSGFRSPDGALLDFE